MIQSVKVLLYFISWVFVLKGTCILHEINGYVCSCLCVFKVIYQCAEC